MVRYNNIICRSGNKQNDIKYFSHLLPLDVKRVVEPFGGSFAVTKHFYKDIEKYDFHINDSDVSLFYVYNNFKDVLTKTHELRKIYDTDYAPECKKLDFKKYFDSLDINPHMKKHLTDTNFIRGNLFKCPKHDDKYNPIEETILKSAIITNLDYTEIFQMYKDDYDAFLFLDPPYLFSDNSIYIPQLDENDMTQIIIDVLEFLKTCKCKVMLIINKLNMLEHLFKDYIRGEYLKIYGASKKKLKHLIICNYDI